MICVLCGGVGAARMLRALQRVVPGEALTAIVNVGDDFVLHGLRISPDLDTVVYTLAGAINADTGWGIAGETWQAMRALDRYGGQTWFSLGDQDLATHLHRTQRLAEGATLTEVTAEIARAWGVSVRILPVTHDPVATRVTVPGEGEIGFQDYFVARRHAVTVTAVRFAGVETALPAPGVLEALADAERIVIAPSNPIVSIGPVLAVPGIRDAVKARRDDVVAVSPIIAGRALKGPAARMMAELGHKSTVVGVARLYADLAATIVLDTADEDAVPAVEAAGVRPLLTGTVMADPAAAERLARVVLGA